LGHPGISAHFVASLDLRQQAILEGDQISSKSTCRSPTWLAAPWSNKSNIAASLSLLFHGNLQTIGNL
jgi:hypothetical protein